MTSPLASAALFHLGPVPITKAVLATWVIMAVLGTWRQADHTPDVADPVENPGDGGTDR